MDTFLFCDFCEGNNSRPNLTFIFGKLYSPQLHGTHNISFFILLNFWHKVYKFIGCWHCMQVKAVSNFNFELIKSFCSNQTSILILVFVILITIYHNYSKVFFPLN